MAAFCACCGAEITPKAGACSVCGTPRHGMMPRDMQPEVDLETNPAQAESEASQKVRRPRL